MKYLIILLSCLVLTCGIRQTLQKCTIDVYFKNGVYENLEIYGAKPNFCDGDSIEVKYLKGNRYVVSRDDIKYMRLQFGSGLAPNGHTELFYGNDNTNPTDVYLDTIESYGVPIKREDDKPDTVSNNLGFSVKTIYTSFD